MIKFTEAQLAKGYEQAKAALKTVQVRTIARSDIKRCPHFILVANHYRPDGSCRCNDKDHTEMRQWGYRWSKGRWQ